MKAISAEPVFQNADLRKDWCRVFTELVCVLERRLSTILSSFLMDADLSKVGSDMVKVQNHTVECAKLLTVFAKQYIWFHGQAGSEEQRSLMKEAMGGID